MNLFLVFLASAEFDSGAAFGFRAWKAGAFQIVGAELDVRALLGESESRGRGSYLLRLWTEGGRDGACEPVPALGFFAQTLAARGG